jgi:hypothetical protein
LKADKDPEPPTFTDALLPLLLLPEESLLDIFGKIIDLCFSMTDMRCELLELALLLIILALVESN